MINIWEREMIETSRGIFEVFKKGRGKPLCVTHHYSSFNESGDYFADTFTDTHLVILVNLRECGLSEKATESYQLSFIETILDLEEIRKALGFKMWGFAGHSTGGMIGLLYGVKFSSSLLYSIIVGAAAREYQTFSSNCIYNKEHPFFNKMQSLLHLLSDPNVPEEKKEIYKVERTKLSLFNPDNYSTYFKKAIHKSLNPTRLNFFSREIAIFDITKQLCLIKTPTLIICGEHDVQCPVEYSIELAAEINKSKLVIFSVSNHYPFLEEETKFHKELKLFISQLSLSG